MVKYPKARFNKKKKGRKGGKERGRKKKEKGGKDRGREGKKEKKDRLGEGCVLDVKGSEV